MITRNRYNLQGDTNYQGLSTDTKPTRGVPSNSLFLELDTGDVYYGSPFGEYVLWNKIGASVDLDKIREDTVSEWTKDDYYYASYGVTIETSPLPETIIVDYDGTMYVCKAMYHEDIYDYGAPYNYDEEDESGYDFSEYPFNITVIDESGLIYTVLTDETHTFKIYGQGE